MIEQQDKTMCIEGYPGKYPIVHVDKNLNLAPTILVSATLSYKLAVYPGQNKAK